jgi:hypothetical protein
MPSRPSTTWRALARVAAASLLAAAMLAPAVAQAQQAAAAATAGTPAARALPDRLSDAEFWQLFTAVSEPGGYFRLEDNFTSNEPEIGMLFTALRDRSLSGGVYLGVGPEQNYTYMASIRPQMAFLFDIRRQANVQHLMFKAIFEESKDRADFVSMLFSKPRPAGLADSTGIQAMWDAFWYVPSDSALWRRNYQAIVDRLTKTHGFALTQQDMGMLRHVYDSFYGFGPVISTNGAQQGARQVGGASAWTFADLTGYSYDASGQPRSFLSTEDNYRFVKGLHERNLIVPVTGDFGGPKAIRAVGAWLTERNATVTAFYLSNVEQYLFQDGKQSAFYGNVGALPLSPTSVLIRPYSLRGGRGGPAGGPEQAICPVQAFLSAVAAGRIYGYNDAVMCVR